MARLICILGLGNACPSGYPQLILAVVGDQQDQLLVGLEPGVFHSQAPALEVWPSLTTVSVLGGSFMCNLTPTQFALM